MNLIKQEQKDQEDLLFPFLVLHYHPKIVDLLFFSLLVLFLNIIIQKLQELFHLFPKFFCHLQFKILSAKTFKLSKFHILLINL